MPRTSKNMNDPNLLEAALEGLLLQKQRLDTQIQEVRALLNKRGAQTTPLIVSPLNGRKRELSASARRRIAAAQKKRWAEYRKQRPKAE